MNEPAIRIDSLTVGYGRRAVLRDVDLEVPAGTTTVLLGRNGAGKTTLLKACLGLLRPSAGRVRVAGLAVEAAAARVRRLVGYVPDRPDAWPWMSPRDLLRFLGAHFAGPVVARGLALLERFEVPPNLAFRHLSRGQGMKAMLAAALAHDPRVLLLDEPFGGLDAVGREEVLVRVIDALGEAPRTVLLATHDLEVAVRVADAVAVVAAGRVTALEAAAPDAEPALTPDALKAALERGPVPFGGIPACARS